MAEKEQSLSIEDSLEKEQKPSRVILLIRHPSVHWNDFVLDRAEHEGKDIETHTPIDTEGLTMIEFLKDHLQAYLSKDLPSELQTKNLDGKYRILTSPVKRAKDEADIVSTGLNLGHLDNREIPAPKGPIQEDRALTEIFWMGSKKQAMNFMSEAKEVNVHPVKFSLENADPAELAKRFNERMSDVKEILEKFKDQTVPVDLVFSHRLILTLIIWAMKQKNEGRKDLIVTENDIPGIIDLCGQVAYTSISEIWLTKDNKWFIKSIGETPHLNEASGLRKGTY